MGMADGAASLLRWLCSLCFIPMTQASCQLLPVISANKHGLTLGVLHSFLLFSYSFLNLTAVQQTGFFLLRCIPGESPCRLGNSQVLTGPQTADLVCSHSLPVTSNIWQHYWLVQRKIFSCLWIYGGPRSLHIVWFLRWVASCFIGSLSVCSVVPAFAVCLNMLVLRDGPHVGNFCFLLCGLDFTSADRAGCLVFRVLKVVLHYRKFLLFKKKKGMLHRIIHVLVENSNVPRKHKEKKKIIFSRGKYSC